MPHYNYAPLSPQDNDFLLWETPTLPMHTSGVQIFAAGDLMTEAGGIDIDRIKRATEAVLHNIPRYRQKIHWIPGTERAVWVDDPHFSIDYHLRHISLPRPGTDAQLKLLASRIMEYPLDRSRPLWETWVIEGLEGGRFATVAKTHHCMIDGGSGIGLMDLTMTRTPREEIPEPPRFVPRPLPSDSTLRRDDRARLLELPGRMLSGLRSLSPFSEDEGDGIGKQLRAMGDLARHKLVPASQTALNGDISPHRIFDFTEVPLADLRAIRKALEVSINDVVLAVVTGAVRQFLRMRSARVEDLDFRVSTPVNVRTAADEGYLGNRVSSWIVPLPLAEPDPLARVASIHETTLHLKESNQASVVDLINSLREWVPLPIDIQAASRGTQNMIVTNVPGPSYPLYLMGAELLGIYPQAPLIENLGLVIGLISYNGRVCWGFNADQDRVPDLPEFVAAVRRSFEQLTKAAGI